MKAFILAMWLKIVPPKEQPYTYTNAYGYRFESAYVEQDWEEHDESG